MSLPGQSRTISVPACRSCRRAGRSTIIKELAHQQGLPVELPFLQRKSSYHNYRILSHRHPQERQTEEGEGQWRKKVLPELQKSGRTRTEPREYALSTERDRVYSIVKHYREGSLKKMDLHLNMGKLKRWHNHNRNLAAKREAQAYKIPPKQPFHQLQLHH